MFLPYIPSGPILHMTKLFQDLQPAFRHYYEVIPEHRPCKLYFDIEYKKCLNTCINGDEMLQKFIEILINDLRVTFDIDNISQDESIINLESSTNTKFSHHIIINHPDLIFADNYQAGNYVKNICRKLRNMPEMQIVVDENIQVSQSEPHKSKYGIFVDEGVYTKNRNFRIFMSSKFGKKVCLLSANNLDTSDKDIFLTSLVTNISEGDACFQHHNKSKRELKLLTFESREQKETNIKVINSKQKIVEVHSIERHENR